MARQRIEAVGTVSRREFMAGASIFFASLILGEGWYLVDTWSNQLAVLREDWDEAHRYKTANEFIEANAEWLSHLRLGFNLSPEQLDGTFHGQHTHTYVASLPTPEEVIALMQDELGLSSGRFTIRMSNSLKVSQDFEVHLEYYQPWLDEFARRKIPLTLNAGIKAARWPELHVPPELLEKLYPNGRPGNYESIDPTDPLGRYALGEYYPALYEELLRVARERSYPESFFTALQPENEPFSPFGELKWRVSKEYLFEAIALTHRYFPKAHIVQNSPIVYGTFREINEALVVAQEHIPTLKGKLVSGVNHYYKQPHPQLLSMKAGDERLFDNMVSAEMSSQVTGDLEAQRELLRSNQIKLMTTELQMEPWQPYTSPGNNFQELVFILLRNRRVLEPLPRDEKTEVLVWGVEELLYNMGNKNHPQRSHHLEITALLQGINQL